MFTPYLFVPISEYMAPQRDRQWYFVSVDIQSAEFYVYAGYQSYKHYKGAAGASTLKKLGQTPTSEQPLSAGLANLHLMHSQSNPQQQQPQQQPQQQQQSQQQQPQQQPQQQTQHLPKQQAAAATSSDAYTGFSLQSTGPAANTYEGALPGEGRTECRAAVHKHALMHNVESICTCTSTYAMSSASRCSIRGTMQFDLHQFCLRTAWLTNTKMKHQC